MITKERLKELIRQGATAWSNSFKEEVNLKDSLGLEKIRDKLILKIRESEGFISYYDVAYLEEDVETAKFKDEYQNITRTETLSLPTWEEFLKKIRAKSLFIFRDRNGINWVLKDTLKGTTTIILLTNGVSYFECDYNKKGYLEICEKCKQLFLGEDK